MGMLNLIPDRNFLNVHVCDCLVYNKVIGHIIFLTEVVIFLVILEQYVR